MSNISAGERERRQTMWSDATFFDKTANDANKFSFLEEAENMVITFENMTCKVKKQAGDKDVDKKARE